MPKHTDDNHLDGPLPLFYELREVCRERREAAGISQSAVVRAYLHAHPDSEMANSSISNAETRKKGITERDLEAYALALGTTPEDLMAEALKRRGRRR